MIRLLSKLAAASEVRTETERRTAVYMSVHEDSSTVSTKQFADAVGFGKKSIEAVFISDLHLHPNNVNITKRFDEFIQWAAIHTQSVYILGDFFHVWAGDDGLDAWSAAIADKLVWLSNQQVSIYFLAGNRDFLIGAEFIKRARMKKLIEPAIIQLHEDRVLLVHGDRYCTNDKGHQWLRRLTRNRIFITLFGLLPFTLRARLVAEVRQHSQNNHKKSVDMMDVVPAVMLNHMHQLNVSTIIHGHTHKPGLTTHHHQNKLYRQYVLSDWDANPLIMCYNKSRGLCFDLCLEK